MELILLLFLLLSAALTAASEISMVAANRFKLKRMASEGSKAAKMVLKILETPERFLGMILVVNNIIDTFIASLVTVIMVSLIGTRNKSVLFATIIGAFLIIIFEVVAKTLAARRAERLALVLATPAKGMIFLLSPIIKVLEIITNFVIRVIGGDVERKQTLVTEEEIKALIKIGEEEGVLHKEKYKMLSRVFDFSEVMVKNVMTPKKDMTSIDMNSKLEEILEKVLESGYSRLPVYSGNPDNIIGVINMKDLLSLSLNKDLVVLQDIIYPVTIVPDFKKVTELLKEFQKGHTHLAVVVNSQGKLEGIVTLEDLLEEIVGEIEDEYDVRASHYKKKNVLP